MYLQWFKTTGNRMSSSVQQFQGGFSFVILLRWNISSYNGFVAFLSRSIFLFLDILWLYTSNYRLLYEKDLDVVTEAAKGDQWTHCCVHDTSVTRIIIRLEAATKMVRCTWSATIGIQIMTALLPQGQIQQIFLIPPILLSVTAVTLYTAIHRPSRKSSVNSLLQLCPFLNCFIYTILLM